MNYKIIGNGNRKYIELMTCENPIKTEQDALELIALCGEHDTNLLMLHRPAISDDFFKLKTGAAGRILQKLINYQIKASAIISEEDIKNGKFEDMVLETNRGSHFRVFANRDDAEKWLLKNQVGL